MLEYKEKSDSEVYEEEVEEAQVVTIHVPHGRSIDETVEYVLRLIQQGMTSGYYPTWSIAPDPEGIRM